MRQRRFAYIGCYVQRLTNQSIIINHGRVHNQDVLNRTTRNIRDRTANTASFINDTCRIVNHTVRVGARRKWKDRSQTGHIDQTRGIHHVGKSGEHTFIGKTRITSRRSQILRGQNNLEILSWKKLCNGIAIHIPEIDSNLNNLTVFGTGFRRRNRCGTCSLRNERRRR